MKRNEFIATKPLADIDGRIVVKSGEVAVVIETDLPIGHLVPCIDQGKLVTREQWDEQQAAKAKTPKVDAPGTTEPATVNGDASAAPEALQPAVPPSVAIPPVGRRKAKGEVDPETI